jgi:glucose-6-phosphate dehydrogenase assembly protein OpcA
VVELPSAALPLLVPDLSTFLWWRSGPHAADKVLDILLRATDRLVIDSAEFADPERDLDAVNSLYRQDEFRHVGISDLNWARLTFWRGLLADFYDVQLYQTLLEGINSIQIDYAAPASGEARVAPQAFLVAGWLASRLGWKLADEQPPRRDEKISFNFFRNPRGSAPTVNDSASAREIRLDLNRVSPGEHKPGRLVQVELRGGASGGEKHVSFVVARSADNLHVLAEARVGASTHRGRVLPVRNRSAAQLLSREMEILCNDQIYQEALAVAAEMIERLPT